MISFIQGRKKEKRKRQKLTQRAKKYSDQFDPGTYLITCTLFCCFSLALSLLNCLYLFTTVLPYCTVASVNIFWRAW